jgi:hypothetical protein
MARRGGVASERHERRRRVALRLRLVLADVREVAAPAIVVGHYRGVDPVNAIGALDARLGGWISLAVKRGMVGGQLGEVFLVPARGHVAADAILIAGMGEPGAFNEDALRVLLTNVAMAAGALGLSSIASVLVGAGEGNLAPATALRALLEGVADAAVQLRSLRPRHRPLRELVLVEHDPARVAQLAGLLTQLRGDPTLGLRLTLALPAASAVRRALAAQSAGTAVARARRSPPARRLDEVWLTLERPPGDGAGRFRFSAMTRHAVVPVREVEVEEARFRALAEALQSAPSAAEQDRYGRLLFEYLMPEDFDGAIASAAAVRLVVDATTAAYPWEMACFRPGTAALELQRLGLEKRLTRQFRTTLSRAPGTLPPPGRELRVLVIADPAPEPELQLPAARREGRRVVEALKRRARAGAPVRVESRIGSGECAPLELLALVLAGDFDVVHYAGHGEFDPANPAAAGWVLGAREVLRASDVFRARRVPRLVFANACYSGAIHGTAAFPPAALARGSATVAQAFFERGLPNFVGTGWPVGDTEAGDFAVAFYGRLLAGATLREALHAARLALFARRQDTTWGAYQHYGDPDDVLLRAAPPPPMTPGRRR